MSGPGAGQKSLLVAKVDDAVSGMGSVLERLGADRNGTVVHDLGHVVCVAFASVGAAIVAGRDVMGCGAAVAIDTEGEGLGRALRILEATNPGQVLLSGAAVAAARLPARDVVGFGLHLMPELIEPVRLFGLRADGTLGSGRPPRAPRLQAGDLPEPMRPLFGRARDLDEVLALLSRPRLVTLTGIGGIGKTSVALEAARREKLGARDGVWLARLETCSSTDEVTATVLSAVGVEPKGPRRGVDALVDGLRHRHAVVVLDNCEHVLDPVVRIVVDVLEACRGVRILATSREPLEVAAERVYRVPPLDTSGRGPATQLFCDRARAAGAHVVPAEDPEIEAICARLEGIPLAIELAAARCRSLRPADLLVRLDDMLDALGTGGRDVPGRHRTLAAALEWSYNLLSPAEQLVLARASVFAGPFGLDAAAAVCAGGPVRAGGVADLLDHLVGRSLVVALDDSPRSRFRLLEPVRQFARERLTANERRATTGRHTRFFAELMHTLGARWRSGDDQGAWPLAEADLANLRAAFDELVERRRSDDAEQFVVDAYGPIAIHVDSVPESEWAPRALAIDPDHVGPATAGACAVAAWGATTLVGPDAAATWLRRGEAAIRAGSLDDGLLVAAAMHQVTFGSQSSVSAEFIETSLVACDASDDLHRQVWVYGYTWQADRAVARPSASAT